MKSSIDLDGELAQPRSSGTDSSELAELEAQARGILGKGGVYLDGCGSGALGEVSSFKGRNSPVGLLPRAQHHPREGAADPSPGGTRFLDIRHVI